MIIKKKQVYLDNAATSFPKPDCVLRGINDYMLNNGTSSSRGGYRRAIESDHMVYETRKLIGQLFNHSKASDVIFTANVTESLNLAIRGILHQGDHVITSSIEHNSVWRCIKTLERDRNISITQIKCSSTGITVPSDVEENIQKNTKLIVFNHASNVVGTIQPVSEIGEIAKRNNIPFLVDAAQTAGALPIDMVRDNIALLAFTGHKSLLGPTGIGGLVINWGGYIEPWKAGGTGGDSVNPFQPDYLPNKFEAGTLNIAGIAGLQESLKYILEKTVEQIRTEEFEITRYALDKLENLSGIQVYGPRDPEQIVGVISFNMIGIAAEEVGAWLDQNYDIMVRTGLHCAPLIHEIMGTKEKGTVRLGIGHYTDKDDIDYLIDALSLFLRR